MPKGTTLVQHFALSEAGVTQGDEVVPVKRFLIAQALKGASAIRSKTSTWYKGSPTMDPELFVHIRIFCMAEKHNDEYGLLAKLLVSMNLVLDDDKRNQHAMFAKKLMEKFRQLV